MAGVGEAYTPTFVGPDGSVYAINNATLFVVGFAPVPEPVTVLGLFGVTLAAGSMGRRYFKRVPSNDQ